MLLLFATKDIHSHLRPSIAPLEAATGIYTFSLRLPIYSALESLLCDPFSTDPLPFDDPDFLGSFVSGRAGHVTHEVLIGELTAWVEEYLYLNHLSSQLASSVEYAYDDGVADTFLLTHIRDMRDVTGVINKLVQYRPVSVLIAEAHSLFMNPQGDDSQASLFSEVITSNPSNPQEAIFNNISDVISRYTAHVDHEQRTDDEA